MKVNDRVWEDRHKISIKHFTWCGPEQASGRCISHDRNALSCGRAVFLCKALRKMESIKKGRKEL